jgi:hypothetical protein
MTMTHPELSRHCIPWTPYKRPLEEAIVCIVSSAGVRLKDDAPFNTDGDLSYRSIRGDASGADLTYDDAHFDHACADADINCIFPVDRLRESVAAGKVARAAERHFSFGFSMQLRQLREQTSTEPGVPPTRVGWRYHCNSPPYERACYRGCRGVSVRGGRRAGPARSRCPAARAWR